MDSPTSNSFSMLPSHHLFYSPPIHIVISILFKDPFRKKMHRLLPFFLIPLFVSSQDISYLTVQLPPCIVSPIHYSQPSTDPFELTNLDTLLCIGHQPALRHAQQLGLCLFLSLQPSKLLQRRMYRGCARVYILRSDR